LKSFLEENSVLCLSSAFFLEENRINTELRTELHKWLNSELRNVSGFTLRLRLDETWYRNCQISSPGSLRMNVWRNVSWEKSFLLNCWQGKNAAWGKFWPDKTGLQWRGNKRRKACVYVNDLKQSKQERSYFACRLAFSKYWLRKVLFCFWEASVTEWIPWKISLVFFQFFLSLPSWLLFVSTWTSMLWVSFSLMATPWLVVCLF